MTSSELSPEQKGIKEDAIGHVESFEEYFTRIAHSGHTKEERDRIDETTRRLHEALPPGLKPGTGDIKLSVSIHDLPLELDPSVLEQ